MSKSSFQVQLVKIIQRKGNTSLFMPNENDETPHCMLKSYKGECSKSTYIQRFLYVVDAKELRKI